jgi:hypothetical protein
MFRESTAVNALDAGAKYVFLMASPAKGVTWATVGSVTVAMAHDRVVNAGLALTSHSTSFATAFVRRRLDR